MAESDEMEKRFGGVGRLVSGEGLERLKAAHVCVLGIGGVGSWTVEALARSGLGALTLVDLDEVCVSNVNRQVHAMDGTVGRPKVAVMAERARAIRPGIEVHAEEAFYTEGNATELLGRGFDYVVDAIDDGRLKAHLVAACKERGVPVVVCGGVGGRRDATKVSVADLGRAFNDPLLSRVRRELRNHYGYPKWEGRKFGAACVFSEERPVFPAPEGGVCGVRGGGAGQSGMNCESGFGTGAWVTGVMGMVAAQVVVEAVVGGS